VASSAVDLEIQLGRLRLPNPILVASGTFGYAREMAGLVDLSRLGAIIPKTITMQPRPGNAPWRTVETAGGMLNSIGLDNDGIEHFIAAHLPYLGSLGAPVIVSIAGRTLDDFVELAARLDGRPGVSALELNVSCPNVSGGVDFGTDPELCRRVVAGVRGACGLPALVKLTPNVTDIVTIARAAEDGGADAISLINTVLGMAIDWRRRRPLLGNGLGGLSGPAIKPIALRAVYQVAQAVTIPLVGIGGIASINDVMEFLLAGAAAVQLGTVNYYRPTVSMEVLDALPDALAELGATSVREVVGTLRSAPWRPAAQVAETRDLVANVHAVAPNADEDHRRLYRGASGQMAVLSEFLYRSINVAVPEVDVGDDVFVVRERDETVLRVQVKHSKAEDQQNGSYVAQFNLPWEQFDRPDDTPPLVYVLAVRRQSNDNGRWSDFIVIRRSVLRRIQADYAVGSVNTDQAGNPSGLKLRFVFTQGDVRAKGNYSFQSFRNAFEPWPPPLRPVPAIRRKPGSQPDQ